MRKFSLIAFCALSSALLSGQSGLTGSCPNGGDYPSCVGGEVRFTGSGYADQVHITVTNSAGKQIDDGVYKAKGGALSFTENLSFSDTYTIYVDDTAVLTVTTN